jgi:hypothetical protein
MNRLTFIAVVICLFLTATVASGQYTTPARDGVIAGFFACAGSDAERDCPFRIHYVDMVKGRTYLLRMESTESSAHFMIEDLYGNSLATVSDDFNTMPACVVFRAPATAAYRLIASATNPIEEGYYRVSMREVPSLFEVAAELTSNDRMRNDCHERTYDVPLVAGRRYVIDLGSRDFEAYVKLMTTEDVIVAFEDESTPMRGARLVFTPTRTEVYRIVATTLMPNSTGAFTLNVTELE